MISKELFVESMNELKKSWDMATKLNEIFDDYDRRDFLDGFGFCEDKIQDYLLKVIADSFGEGCEDLLNWWCWECVFGSHNAYIYFGGQRREDPFFGEPEEPFMVLDTPEKLYDYFIIRKYL